MSKDNYNENALEVEQSSSKQEEPTEEQEKRVHLHSFMRRLVWVFIILNALVILLALFPTIIPMPFLRHIAMPTLWHFHSGYGTPLGLSIWSSIVVVIACMLQILRSKSFLKQGLREWRKFCVVSVIIAVICTGILMWRSDSPRDYVRESLIRDLPESMQIRADTMGGSGFLRVEVSTSTETVPISEFEDFVTDVQSQVLETVQRRRVRDYFFIFALFDTDKEELMFWRPASGEIQEDYGHLILRDVLAPYVMLPSLHERVPTANIQEIIDTVIIINNFAKEIVDEDAINEIFGIVDVRPLLFVDRENKIDISGIEAGKVCVEIWMSSETFSTYKYEVETSIIEIDAYIKEIAQRHNLDVYRFFVSFRPIDLVSSVSWSSGGSGEYGTLRFGWWDEFRFYGVHITEIQELITEDLVAEIQERREIADERSRIAWTYERLNVAFSLGIEHRLTTGRGRPGNDGDTEHISFNELFPEQNSFGIYARLYLLLRFFESMTGNILSYETVVDYFSEEFEPDGSLRLYDNGLHPEIQSFVKWVGETAEWRFEEVILERDERGNRHVRGRVWHWQEFEDYLARIRAVYASYLRADRYRRDDEDARFDFLTFLELSPQMLDALARAEADPEYELDLARLQRAGY